MPKTPSSKLFNLIKSLSGSEKRYFNIYANNKWGDRQNKYLKLFTAIDQQKDFDEEALKQEVYKDEKFESRKYSELKAYLYELILKSLQGYDEKSSFEYKLNNLMQHVRVLYKRAHYSEAKEQLAKARKMATQYESFVTTLEILNWEKQIAYTESDIAFLDKELNRIDEEEQRCLEQLRNLSIYKNIFYQFMISIRKDAILRSDSQMSSLKRLLDHPLLKNEAAPKSHRAKVLYHRIYGLYYYSISDYEQFYYSSKKFLGQIELQPHLLKEDVSDYISAVSNLSLSSALTYRYDEVRISIDKFLEINPLTEDDEVWIHKQYYSFKLNLCTFTGAFEEGLVAMEKHFEERKKFDPINFETGSFYLQYFNIYFGAGDYDKALDSLNSCLNLPRSIERQDLQSLGRILNLVIHYEMGNTMLLEYLLRSAYRFLRQRNRIFEFEKRVMSFIKSSNKLVSAKQVKKAFKILKEDFESLSQIPSEKAMMQYFDFVAWLESKIENKPFAEVIRQRANATKAE
ncbi:MAG: hypothetical protein ACI8YQ_000389 [Polaribacter sp.]|jgi:hypothetical protein